LTEALWLIEVKSCLDVVDACLDEGDACLDDIEACLDEGEACLDEGRTDPNTKRGGSENPSATSCGVFGGCT
jgi:hypothetical protein